jgi:FkbM family methyltransferase
MKRIIVNKLNQFLSIFNISISKAGFDMLGRLKLLKKEKIQFNSVIDIGASNGKWSVDALNLFHNSKIIAIEPLIEREPSLKKLKNKFKNFDYVLTVAGDGTQNNIELSVTEDLDGSTISGNKGETRIVPSKSIDQIVIEKELKAPFFLKFDTHGFETSILNGAKHTLKNTEIILMETYNFKITEDTLLFHEMIEYLYQKGFRVFNIADPLNRPYDNTFWQVDIFFIKETNKYFKYNSYK